MRMALTALLLASASPCAAATIDIDPSQSPPIIWIDGGIDQNDYDVFIAKTGNIEKGTVRLRSPGGLVSPAIAIGKVIRKRGYDTSVVELCASACGLIWVAGSKRYLLPGSQLGFHQPHELNGAVSIAAVALIGAYLGELGLFDRAIAYAVAAGPSDMRWLTHADAQRLGIAITPNVLPSSVELPAAPVRDLIAETIRATTPPRGLELVKQFTADPPRIPKVPVVHPFAPAAIPWPENPRDDTKLVLKAAER